MKDTERRFAGFPVGGVQATPVPNVVFSDLLPRIDDLAEAKVTLHVLWLLHKKRGFPRCVTLRELQQDGTLLGGLAKGGSETALPDQESGREEGRLALLRRGLELAVQRGSLLRLDMERDGQRDEYYFVNSLKSRETIAKLRSAEIEIGQVVLDTARAVVPKRPDVVELYEQNFGPLTPLLAEDLSEAEALYPSAWIEDAMREALRYNRRYWGYVRRILERWAFEGKRDEESRGGYHGPGQGTPGARRKRARGR